MPNIPNHNTGRVAGQLARKLRKQIRNGRIAAGHFMPPVRQLAADHGVAKVTARRALKMLEAEGLLVAQPRKGFQVLLRAGDPAKGLPVAYIYSGQYAVGPGWDEAAAHRTLMEFQRVAGERNWSLLVVRGAGRSPGEITNDLKEARACGAIIDVVDQALLKALQAAGMPVVVVDNFVESGDEDSVVQDGFMGGMQAAAHLAKLGHRRFGWLGPEPAGGDPQIHERLGGALGGLFRAGLTTPALRQSVIPIGHPEEAARVARAALAAPDRPKAFFALWQDATAAMAAAAAELRLTPGRDFDMVGWCTREEYEAGFPERQGLPPNLPVITWSLADMAEMAVSRLIQRRNEPTMPFAALRVHVRLMTGRNERT